MNKVLNPDSLAIASLVAGGAVIALSDKGSPKRKIGWALVGAPFAAVAGFVGVMIVGTAISRKAIS